jgi:predicted alpha-1,6-mannanase (GH76 family)
MTTYTWQDVGDENNKILTQEEKQTIADKWNANEQERASIQWKINRENEYPSWQDQMDMQYHDKVNGTSTWQTAIAKVKSDNPKE